MKTTRRANKDILRRLIPNRVLVAYWAFLDNSFHASKSSS